MKIKHFLLIVVLLCSVSCGSSETLIVGQLAEYDEEAIDSDSFKGQTIYVYRESEIKAFLENKNLAVTDVISQLNKIHNKCDELEKKIPTFNSLEIEKYDQAKKLASECSNEYELKRSELKQMYFEDLPNAVFSTIIRENGDFAISVPSDNKYVLILPKHSITWVNALGERKFFMLTASVDSNANVVL